MSSSLPAEVPQNSVAGRQKLQISELQFDKFPPSSFFLCWKTKIENTGKFLFRFRLRCNVMDQRSGDGRFSG